MSTPLLVLLILFFLLMVLSVPIAYCIGISGFVALLLLEPSLPIQIFAQKTMGAMDSFTILAVPFFIISGELMLKGGIARRLIALADAIVGGMKGGMAYVDMVASALFGAISGSAVATTTAIGGMMYPEMVKRNYTKPFAGAVGAVGGSLGILIPPSIAAIV